MPIETFLSPTGGAAPQRGGTRASPQGANGMGVPFTR